MKIGFNFYFRQCFFYVSAERKSIGVTYTKAIAINFKTGQDVKQVQEALQSRGFELFPGVDGIFGPSTDAAVKAFQQKNGLVVDGIVGPATRSALDIDED